MKVLFKNKTKYTKQAYEEYLRFHQDKYGLKFQFTTIVFILLFCFCIIMNLKYKNFPAVAFLLLCLGGFVYYQFSHPQKIIQKEFKSDKFEKEQIFTFTFYEKYFTITQKNIKEKLKYHKLHKVFETDDYFYLYLDKTHSLLLSKSGFTVGDISTFLSFIKKKRWHI